MGWQSPRPALPPSDTGVVDWAGGLGPERVAGTFALVLASMPAAPATFPKKQQQGFTGAARVSGSPWAAAPRSSLSYRETLQSCAGRAFASAHQPAPGLPVLPSEIREAPAHLSGSATGRWGQLTPLWLWELQASRPVLVPRNILSVCLPGLVPGPWPQGEQGPSRAQDRLPREARHGRVRPPSTAVTLGSSGVWSWAAGVFF